MKPESSRERLWGRHRLPCDISGGLLGSETKASQAVPANVQQPGKMPRWWKVLYDGRADVILGGHVHSYERFAELRPDGLVDTARSIREFVVGTGGSGLLDFSAIPRVGSQKRLRTWGVLKLTLWPNRYRWQFIDLNGAVRDQGSDRCH